MRNLPGYGDEATWPPCVGHPNDPRTDHEAYRERLDCEVDTILSELKQGKEDTCAEVAENFLRYADYANVGGAIGKMLADPASSVNDWLDLIDDALVTTAQRRVAAEECLHRKFQ